MNIGIIGSRGEKAAASYLKRKGYKILSYNYQTRFGEVDIIARNATSLVFCEVKTRSSDAIALGREAVTLSKQQKLTKAALDFIARYGCEQLQPRFDVIEVQMVGLTNRITHIEDAFEVSAF